MTAVIDPETGLLAERHKDCARRVEVFAEGTEPTDFCSRALHDGLQLPYPLQRFSFDVDGALMVPRNVLERILEEEPELRFRRRRKLLEATTPDRRLRVPVRLLPPVEIVERPEIDPELDHVSWFGTDGRPAQIVWLDAHPGAREIVRSGP